MTTQSNAYYDGVSRPPQAACDSLNGHLQRAAAVNDGIAFAPVDKRFHVMGEPLPMLDGIDSREGPEEWKMTVCAQRGMTIGYTGMMSSPFQLQMRFAGTLHGTKCFNCIFVHKSHLARTLRVKPRHSQPGKKA
ncbi:predicted protein [Histoplasma capsulatum H143]|uniref:Uncharacterized protein n=1 Tax=Ajellomyces capsulatus (strain H143) TaxID=544712 RepID=C6HPX2_AJECH|nr:predicted protein [Histoplasma capsulatum H143]